MGHGGHHPTKHGGHHPTYETPYYEKSLHQNGIGSNDISIVEQGLVPCYDILP